MVFAIIIYLFIQTVMEKIINKLLLGSKKHQNYDMLNHF